MADLKLWQCTPESFIRYRSQVPRDRQHFLTPYDVEALAQGRTYLVGWVAGFFLKNDGEIANLFSLLSGVGTETLEHAIRLGGNRVEYFNEPHLKALYDRHGFIETERYPFDLALIRVDFPDFDPDVSGTPDYVIAKREA